MLKEILKLANELIDSIGPKAEVPDTLEYYLWHKVMNFSNSITKAELRIDSEKAAYILSYFGSDSMDWQSEEYKKTTQMADLARKYARTLSGDEKLH